MSASEYTHRYQQFARVMDFEPGSPHAPMLYEYIKWIRIKWRQWADKQGRKGIHPISQDDHRAFDEWLSKEAA